MFYNVSNYFLKRINTLLLNITTEYINAIITPYSINIFNILQYTKKRINNKIIII